MTTYFTDNGKIIIPDIDSLYESEIGAWNTYFSTKYTRKDFIGSGFEAVTYLVNQEIIGLATAFLDMESQTTKVIKESGASLERPKVVTDNITKLLQENNLNACVLDNSFRKLANSPVGAYPIHRGSLGFGENRELFATILNQGIVLGVVSQGNKSLTYRLLNGQEKIIKFTETTPVNFFSVQIDIVRGSNINDVGSLTSNIKDSFLEIFELFYSVGKDFDKILYETELKKIYVDLIDIKVKYSITEVASYIDSSYEVAFDKHLELSNSSVFVVDITV